MVATKYTHTSLAQAGGAQPVDYYQPPPLPAAWVPPPQSQACVGSEDDEGLYRPNCWWDYAHGGYDSANACREAYGCNNNNNNAGAGGRKKTRRRRRRKRTKRTKRRKRRTKKRRRRKTRRRRRKNRR